MSDQDLKENLISKKSNFEEFFKSKSRTSRSNRKNNKNSAMDEYKFLDEDYWINLKQEAVQHIYKNENKNDPDIKNYLLAYEGNYRDLKDIIKLECFERLDIISKDEYIIKFDNLIDYVIIKTIEHEHIYILRGNTNSHSLSFYLAEKEKDGLFSLIKLNNNIGLKKNSLGLTPLIYSIWGEEERKDTSKLTSSMLFYGNLIYSYTERIPIIRSKVIENEMYPTFLHLESTEILILYISQDKSDFIKKFIEIGKFQFNQISDKSLLSLAVERKSIKCTEFILEYLINIIRKSKESNQGIPTEILNIIENEIGIYLKISSGYLIELFSLFFEEKSKRLQEDFNNLPKFKMIKKLEDIEYSFQGSHSENEYINVKIFQTIIKLPCNSGSKESINFLRNLQSANNLKLYKTQFIKYYIKYKWDEIWLLIFLRDVLFLVNIPLIFIISFFDKGDDIVNNDPYAIYSFIAINIILAILEFNQLLALGFSDYFGVNSSDFKQWIPLIRTLILNASIFINILDIKTIPIFGSEPYIFTVYALYSFCLIFAIAEIDLFSKEFNLFIITFTYPAILSLVFWFQYDLILIISSIIALIAFISFPVFGDTDTFHFNRIIFSLLKTTLSILYLCSGSYLFSLSILFEAVSVGILASDLIHVIIHKDDITCQHIVFSAISPIIMSLNFFFDEFFIIILVLITACFANLAYDIYCYQFKSDCSNIEDDKQHEDLWMSLLILLIFGINPSNSKIQMFAIIILSIVQTMKIYKNNEVFYFKKANEGFKKLVFNLNTLDFIRLVLCGIWIRSIFDMNQSEVVTYALAFATFLRGLTAFRSFDGTRFYIRLIFNSISDISSFMIIFFFSTACFGIISGISKNFENYNYEQAWIYSYYLNLGEFRYENEKFDLYYLTFIAATVVNVIIMLNLIISILGDSFDKFQMSCQEIDCMEMTSVILDIETMMLVYWMLRTNVKHYLVVCEPESIVKHEWEGKIMVLRRQLDEINRKITENDVQMNNKLLETKSEIIEILKKGFNFMQA